MHRHDLELIAALADGTLEDETLARERVDACDECQTEFEMQSRAIAALATVTPVKMTEHEKAALHRDLWTELRTDSPTESAPSAPWWYRWSYAAAGLFVIVGLVAVLSQTNGGDSSDLETVSADVSSAAAEVGGGDPEDGGGDPVEAPEASLAQDDAAGAVSEAAADSLSFFELTEQLDSMRFTGRALSVDEESQYDDCMSEAGLDDHQVIETHEIDGNEYLTVILADAPEDESEDVTYVDGTTCVIVNEDG